MAYKVSFLDDVSYDAGDLNGIATLFDGKSGGFKNNTVYGAADLNNIMTSIAKPGVLYGFDSDMAVSLLNDKAIIAPGRAVFSSGATINISASESLTVESGKKNYVYVEHNYIQNYIKPMISTVIPTGDSILLATIEGTTVIDMRSYSRSRLGKYDSNDTRLSRIEVRSGLGDSAIVNVGTTPVVGYNYLVVQSYVDDDAITTGRGLLMYDVMRNKSVSRVAIYGSSKYYMALDADESIGYLPSQSIEKAFTVTIENNVVVVKTITSITKNFVIYIFYC